MHSTNPELIKLVRVLKKWSRESGAGTWRDVAERLSSSRQRRVTVNVSQLNRYTQRGETVLVPGKVLGAGKIDHPLTVAAFSFSKLARSKIINAKGNCLSIPELMKKKPKGTNVKIIG